MVNWKKLNKRWQYELGQMACFGQSKHQAKQEYKRQYLEEHGNLVGWNPTSVPGKIFSVKSMETYRSEMAKFATWVSQCDDVKRTQDVTKQHATAYLQHLQNEKHLSAWSVTTAMSAINKVCGFELTKEQCYLRERHNENIKRGRGPEQKIDERHRDIVDIIRGCGCRRASIQNKNPEKLITPNRFIWDKNHERVVAVTLWEKNGRWRTAPILNEYKERITEIVREAYERDPSGDKPLFGSKQLNKNFGTHCFRRDYTDSLANQLLDEYEHNKPYCGGDFDIERLVNLKGRDADVGEFYRGYPTTIVAAISGALGHNRLQIAFDNYGLKPRDEE